MTDTFMIEVPGEDDWDDFYGAMCVNFNEQPDEESSAAERLVFEPLRCLVARRDDRIVGTAGILTRQLRVPGAGVPAGHVTYVSVAPTARRQGLLTLMIHRQFEDMAAAGEPVAVLWASEARIYQRFGYGLATRRLALQINTREVGFTAGPTDRSGRLREGTATQFRDTIAKIYDEVYGDRNGWSERRPQHWDYRLTDHSAQRDGAPALRVVVHESDQGPDGYAVYRATDAWGDRGPNGEVRILEAIAATKEAYVRLWGFLMSIDLTRTAVFRIAAIDEPLQFMVNEPVQLGARMTDGLWLRIVDLPAALSRRRYATDVDVVLEVTDAIIPTNSGRWRLVGSPTSASCVPTADPADLACDIRALGAAYLGGSPLAALAGGGQVTEVRSGALATAATAFGWHCSPSAVEVF